MQNERNETGDTPARGELRSQTPGTADADQLETRTARPPKPLAPARPVPTERRIGPYVLRRPLGAGSFGEVWLATRASELACTELAIKVPHIGHVDIDAIRQEAALWARIGSHPNVLPIFEAAIYDGQPIIVSEYVPDGSLESFLERRGNSGLDPKDAVKITLDVLAGLEHLHNRGIVHRDIKPGNILLQNGVPRITDFGISRALDAKTTIAIGTPPFMAPEAFDGLRTVQTDLWSVGVLFYLLLTGAMPFIGRDLVSLLKAIATIEPRQLPQRYSASFGGFIAKVLAKSPDDRYTSAAQMTVDLQLALSQSTDVVRTIRAFLHVGIFSGTKAPQLFVTIKNFSDSIEREVTHIWIESNPPYYLENPKRPLPSRIAPNETWRTWTLVAGIPEQVRYSEALGHLVRVRLSTGEVLFGTPIQSMEELS